MVSLSSLRGKPVLLNFWATWCGPCRAEMPFLQQVYDKYTSQGLVLLEINIAETPATIKDFMSSLKLSMPVLLDVDKKVANAYGINAIPATFLVDKNGVIQQKIIGAFSSEQAIESQLTKILP